MAPRLWQRLPLGMVSVSPHMDIVPIQWWPMVCLLPVSPLPWLLPIPASSQPIPKTNTHHTCDSWHHLCNHKNCLACCWHGHHSADASISQTTLYPTYYPTGWMGWHTMAQHLTTCPHWHPSISLVSQPSNPTTQWCSHPPRWNRNMHMGHLGWSWNLKWRRVCSWLAAGHVLGPGWGLWHLHCFEFFTPIYLSLSPPTPAAMANSHAWLDRSHMQLLWPAIPMQCYLWWLSHLSKNWTVHPTTETSWIAIHSCLRQEIGQTFNITWMTQHRLQCMSSSTPTIW